MHRANDAESRFAPPVTGPRAPLADGLVHEGDMRVPLGLAYDPPPDAVAAALDFVTGGRAVGFVPRSWTGSRGPGRRSCAAVRRPAGAAPAPQRLCRQPIDGEKK